jgi:hypothetical protein
MKNFLVTLIGAIVFISCANNPQFVWVVGTGQASAKVGDSLVNFNINLSSNNLNAQQEGYNFSNFTYMSLNGTSNNGAFKIVLSTELKPGLVGSYPLNAGYTFGEQFASISRGNSYYVTDSTYTGILTITTYDPQLEIISGNFHFTGVLNSTNSDTEVVSNGGFIVNMSISIQQ